MAKLSPYYIIIDITDASIRLVETKTQVAAIAKCHINTLLSLKDRITHGNLIIIPIELERVQRKKRDKK